MRSSSMPIVISSGNEPAAFDELLGLLAERSLVADVLAEEFTGGDMREAGFVFEAGGLSAFARSGQAQKHYVHSARATG